MKEKQETNDLVAEKVLRKFGALKGTFTYVAEDFDEPLDDFKEYF